MTIERVDELPELAPRTTFDPGREVTLAEAESVAGFRPLVPRREGYGTPDEVYVGFDAVTLLYGSRDSVRLLVTQFPRGPDPEMFLKKVAGGDTRIETVVVDGGRAFWIEGAPHAVRFGDSAFREAANTLLWESEGLTLRLEAQISRDEALAIAESMR